MGRAGPHDADQDRPRLASASLLAAYQSERCAPALRSCRRTQQEEAVLNIMTFMESVHTKGYTTIFRGLGEDDNAASFFAWADSDAATQAALTKLDDAIQSPVAPVRQAAFILIETELLYNRLAPVLAVTTLPNVARMLTNILAGSLIFVNYIATNGARISLHYPPPNKPPLQPPSRR